MGDIKLFRYATDGARELASHAAPVEKDLQHVIERHMECFLGIKLLAHEYFTGSQHPGAIDSLGLDENFCPVIIEYKRRNNENVISQGLFYLDWLMDHEHEFITLVREKFGDEATEKIDFTGTRILCVAASFSRYDERAIRQISRNIELVRYRLFEDDLIMLEMLNAPLPIVMRQNDNMPSCDAQVIGMPPELQARIRSMSADVERLYLELLSFAEGLGDDVSIKFLKHYIAMSRLKNFTCFQPLKNNLKLWLNLNPAEIKLVDGFSRDVSQIGHLGSGNVEVDVHCREDLLKAFELIELAYQIN